MARAVVVFAITVWHTDGGCGVDALAKTSVRHRHGVCVHRRRHHGGLRDPRHLSPRQRCGFGSSEDRRASESARVSHRHRRHHHACGVSRDDDVADARLSTTRHPRRDWRGVFGGVRAGDSAAARAGGEEARSTAALVDIVVGKVFPLGIATTSLARFVRRGVDGGDGVRRKTSSIRGRHREAQWHHGFDAAR